MAAASVASLKVTWLQILIYRTVSQNVIYLNSEFSVGLLIIIQYYNSEILLCVTGSWQFVCVEVGVGV